MINTTADILIIGAGTMGLATATSLADRGEWTIGLLDAGQPPHEGGAHHGHTRLVRIAYGEGRKYVEAAIQARAGWRDLQSQAAEAIWCGCGVLNVGDAGDPFLAETSASARRFGLPVEAFDAATVSARWPGWRLAAGQRACFEPNAGVLFAERALAMWRRQVEATPGIHLHTDMSVVSLERRGHDWQVRTQDGQYHRAPRVLLACGRALAPLAAELGYRLPLTRWRKVFAWFSADSRYEVAAFPGFSYTGALGDYYGFPALEGRGVKIGRHDGGQPVTPTAALAPFGAHAADTADLKRLIDAHLLGVGALREGAVCEYIRTPDGDFLIDELAPGLLIAGGFSGHGFKFAPAIGASLAEWLDSGRRPPRLAPFGAARFSSG